MLFTGREQARSQPPPRQHRCITIEAFSGWPVRRLRPHDRPVVCPLRDPFHIHLTNWQAHGPASEDRLRLGCGPLKDPGRSISPNLSAPARVKFWTPASNFGR